jgi:hypothetical protein
MALIAVLGINTVHGIPIYKNDETNMLDCYEGKTTALMQKLQFLPYDVDFKKPEVRQFIKNWCQYQIDLTDLTIGSTEEFYVKYYPNGVPEPVKDLAEYLDTLVQQEQQQNKNSDFNNELLKNAENITKGLDRAIDNLENGKNDWTPEKCKSMDELGLKDNLLKQHCPDYKRENK